VIFDLGIPQKGYCKGNVVFTTHRINTCKCDLSLDEIKEWMSPWYQKIKDFAMKTVEVLVENIASKKEAITVKKDFESFVSSKNEKLFKSIWRRNNG
jgi:hypothetical protein